MSLVCARCNRSLKPTTPPVTLAGASIYLGPVCVRKLAAERSGKKRERAAAPADTRQRDLFEAAA